MKLSKHTIDLILQATHLCSILDVPNLILDDAGIRGYNDSEGIAVASFGDHNFEFESLGLARITALKQRTSIIKDLSKLTVTGHYKKGNDDVVEKLVFSCGKINFDFRCAVANRLIDTPTTKLDTTPLFYFDLTEEDVSTITQGASAMRTKNVTIQSVNDRVNFRFSDETDDILNVEADSAVTNNSDSDSFSLTINIKKMLPIFKLAVQEGSFRLNILKNKSIHVVIGDMDVLVMPEV